MKIEDFEINIKTYNRKKGFVIINLLVLGELEIRGFRARYTTTKNSPSYPVWVISPPAVPIKSKFFWIVRIKNSSLWQQLQGRIKEEAINYTNKSNLTL